MKKAKLDRQIQKKLEKIKLFRLLDDTFMSKVFESKECVELLLRIILGIPNLVVIECRTQYELKNLQGRSIRLDIYARAGNRYFNIEIQRNDKGALPKRARYHSALVDADALKAGESFEQLPESYVIFITENDVFEKGLPVYHIDRMVKETQEPFEDEAHIVYVNAQNVNKKTKLGKLMADFHCTKAEDMHYPVLAERVRYFKEKKEGVNTMCQIMEELCDEAENKGMAAGIAKGMALGVSEGMAKGLTKGKAQSEVRMIINLMESMDVPMERAMDILKVSAKDRQAYAGLVVKKLKKRSK